MDANKNLRKRLAALAIGFSLAVPGALFAQATDIADGPLAQPATSVKPNMLLILDDSGSMARQFTPDYVSSNSNAGTMANCFDSLDGGTITETPDDCFAGDPPAMTPDFNTQYYNPEIRYFPAVNYDGTSRGSMDSVATSGWRLVPTDNVSSAAANDARKRPHTGNLSSTTAQSTDWDTGNPATPVLTMDLTSEFPDRVWCKTAADSATDTSLCKINSAYTYPEFTYGVGVDGAGDRKYKLGAPYYYRIQTTEFCTDATLTTCTLSSSPTIVGGVTYNVPAKVRFCDSTAHTSCQAKRTSTFKYPKFLGRVNPSSAGVTAVKSRGRITLTAGDSGAPTIQQITVTRPDGTSVNLLSAVLTTVATNSATNRTTAATAIRDAINANTSLGLNHGYVASLGTTGGSTQQIFIDAPTIPTDNNVVNDGTTISVNALATSGTPAFLSFTMGGANNTNDKVSSLRIGPPGGPAVDLIAAGGVSCGSGCSNTQMANRLRDAINALTGTHGYTSTASGATVTITAPAGTGSERNGWPMTWADTGLNNQDGLSLGGGSTVGDLSHTTTAFTGGINPQLAGTAARTEVGTFVRTNIVLAQTYPKGAGRSDCAGATACTYEEEMTNFANWFAYYRTRFQMAKTSIGRAFLTLGSDFRVGFMTINFSTTHWLAVNDFDTAATQQKDQWFGKLYNATDSGSTPLRGALSRAGRYYGNQDPGGTMGASPIQQSCQPSYSILTSDGYWNDSSGYVQLNGTTNVGNQDSGTGNPPAEVPPYATKASGSWDGNGVSNTLADVAMYYYKTDLSPLADQVPSSGKDNAPHQHMTTFTVGMGLAGTFTYDPNYETQTAGDFKDVTQGTKFWPNPGSQEEAKLDDLWHAAVNGRGKFFSAQDPVALANGIAETLNSVQSRIGAGAAAATSNLQPVAGDNFAFTAQYQTVEWSGDLKARTIDLSTGAVATRELWSAQALLDQRDHATRRILTFDPADTDPTATVVVDSVTRTQNGNKLRSFCAKDSPAATYPRCDDGGLLTPAEMDAHFDPLGGPNGQLFQSVPWPTDGSNRHLSATKLSLIDYLRGETVNETSGGTGTTDLYRNRAHLLGDIVNAQPAYVKAPPFQYSDANYSAFKSANASRFGMVYAAANDGMLHAFATDPDGNPYFQTAGIATPVTGDDTFTGTLSTDPVTGEGSENWSYIPDMVFPTLKRLAETNYSTNHRYSVDGSPVVGDVCSGTCASVGAWRTIIVAGLNKGGRGYYALDITNPQAPVALWELKGGSDATCIASDAAVDGTQTGDCNIGFTFGNPVIAKRPSDGKWVVFVTSGHNNISPGDGQGHLYVVDALTGAILQRMTTPAGDTTTPSGLARINGWVDNASVNNTVKTIYGGDLLGNLWRFQLEAVAPLSANTLSLLGTLTDPGGTPQPITTRPELGQDPLTLSRIVFVATGKFLGVTDKADQQRQSVYAIKDPMNVQNLTGVINMARSGGTIAGFRQQTFTATSTTRAIANNTAVDFATENGWFVDLPDGGSGSPSERVNVDPILQLGTLVVPSNVPSADTCVAGGYGWVNFFDFRSGGFIQGSTGNMVSMKISASLVVGINVVQLPGGTVKTIVTTADNQQITQDTPVAPSNISGRRVTWREMFVE